MRAERALDASDDVRAASLWLSLQQRSWRSLAILAGGPGVDTLETANSLARMGWWFTGQPTCVLDMRDMSLRLLEHQVREMAAQLRGGERAFVALRSIPENPTAVPLAKAADAVVLCVELGSTDIQRAREAIRVIGRSRFLGTILVPKCAPAPCDELSQRARSSEPEPVEDFSTAPWAGIARASGG